MDPVHTDILKGTEIGLAFSGAMWGVTTMQTFSYFQRFKSDSLYLKLAVGLIWITDTIYILLEVIGIHRFIQAISHGTYARIVTPEMPMAAMCASVNTFLVQLVYIARIHVLWGKIHVPILCGMGALYGLISGIYFTSHVVNLRMDQFSLTQRRLGWLVTSWYSISAVDDVIITATLCYLLRRDRKYLMPRTLKVVDKLVLWTIETGMVTSILGVVIAATYTQVILRGPGIWLGLAMVISSLYPLTMVVMLNGRTLLRSMHETGVSKLKNVEPQNMQVAIDQSVVVESYSSEGHENQKERDYYPKGRVLLNSEPIV